MDDTTTRRDPLSKPERRLIWATVLFVLLVGGTCGWWYWINLPPEISIPSQVLPVPNGFGIMETAAGMMVYEMDFSKPKYRRVLRVDGISNLIDGNRFKPYRVYLKWDDNAPQPTMTERKALLAANAGAIKVYRQALALQFVIPRSKADDMKSMTTIDRLMQVMFASGAVKAAGGDRVGAMTDYLDTLQGEIMLARGGGLLGMFFGISRQRKYRLQVWQALNALPIHAVRETLHRLAQMNHPSKSYIEYLREEKYIKQSALLWTLAHENWRSIPSRHKWNLSSQRKVMSDYTRYLDAHIAVAKLPYTHATPSPPFPGSMTMISLEVEYQIPDGYFFYCYNAVQHDMLTMAYALRAYYLEHNTYPATLSELAPTYITTVPTDPFAKSAPLHYRRKGDSYVLYSIGPDGKDDGGTPSIDGHHPLPKVTTLKWGVGTPTIFFEKSTGDIVAGINVN